MSDTLDKKQAQILAKRAEILAKPLEELSAREEVVSLLEFSMITQRYAVQLDYVQAVTRVSEITSIPLVPKHIPGIIRRRGESIALVNLPYFFNANRGGIADADFAVIVQVKDKRFALQVEEILGVTTLKGEDLRIPQENFDPTQISYVSHVTMDGLLLLNLEAILDADGFVVEKYSN